MNKLFYFLAFLFLGLGISAQEQTAQDLVLSDAPHALGITANDTRGMAFTYRYSGGPVGIQISGMGTFNPVNPYDFLSPYYLSHTAGLALQFHLVKVAPTQWFHSVLYIPLGADYFASRSWEWSDTQGEDIPGDYSWTLGANLGVGVEFGLFRHIIWTFEVVERGKWDLGGGLPEIGPHVTGGVFYRF